MPPPHRNSLVINFEINQKLFNFYKPKTSNNFNRVRNFKYELIQVYQLIILEMHCPML